MGGGDPPLLRIGSSLLALGAVWLLAAPLTIIRALPDLSTRASRHTLAGALGLVALAILEFVLAVRPVRRGEAWALLAAAMPFLVVGVPMFVVDATHVARPRLWNTLAPQGAGLVVGGAALVMCALGRAGRPGPPHDGK
jgi:hypothetical protein